MPSPDRDPEQVLSQALRAMAGGSKPAAPGRAGTSRATPARMTTVQLLLLGLLIGLIVGIAAGLISLLV